MSRNQNDVFGVTPEVLAVQPGVTLATYVQGTTAQVDVSIKYISGGTLTMLSAASNGSTIAGATLAALNATAGYLFGSTELMNLAGPASFYLASQSATTVVHLLRKRGVQ